MPLTHEEKEHLVELARQQLHLKPDELQEKLAIDQAYEREQEKLLNDLKLTPAQREEDQEELDRAHHILLLNQQKQTRMAMNIQTANEDAQMNSKVTVQDNLGRDVVIDMPTMKDINQLPPNGVFLLPKWSGPGKDGVDIKKISEEIVEQIANKQGLNPTPQFNKSGQPPCFMTTQKLNDQQKWQLQKDFNNQLATRLKATQTQQAQMQKPGAQPQQTSSIRSPLATTPKPPTT